MKKLYQVFFVDEYNNNYEIGWFKNLDDCINDLNNQINIYGDGKYVLEKGDIKEYPSTFSFCFDTMLYDVFADKNPELIEDIDSELQSWMVRGFVHCFNDEDYETAVKLLVSEENINSEETVSKFDYFTLKNLLQSGRSRTILKAIKTNEDKFINELLNSLIETSLEKVNLENISMVDYNKFGIDKEKIFSKKEIEELEEIYCQNEYCISSDCPDKLSEYENKQAEMKLLGYYIYNWQVVEYYVKDDLLLAFVYYCVDNKKRSLSFILVAQKENGVM